MRRQPVRPRYGRIGVLLVSVGLTLGSAGAAALGMGPYPKAPPAQAAVSAQNVSVDGAGSSATDAPAEDIAAPEAVPEEDPQVPAGSGHGRRVVFDMSDQRVWLVRADGSVHRTYLVSGSRVDNVQAGSFEVYSRSRHATGYTGSTTMDYMVRFTTGEQAAIGFHDIPVDAAGRPVQGIGELGTATSAGCIRQRTADAKVMWAFARLGTPVVVVD
jgi:hypothetical protein